jgi:hypothetical protein
VLSVHTVLLTSQLARLKGQLPALAFGFLCSVFKERYAGTRRTSVGGAVLQVQGPLTEGSGGPDHSTCSVGKVAAERLASLPERRGPCQTAPLRPVAPGRNRQCTRQRPRRTTGKGRTCQTWASVSRSGGPSPDGAPGWRAANCATATGDLTRWGRPG